MLLEVLLFAIIILNSLPSDSVVIFICIECVPVATVTAAMVIAYE